MATTTPTNLFLSLVLPPSEGQESHLTKHCADLVADVDVLALVEQLLPDLGWQLADDDVPSDRISKHVVQTFDL